MDLNLVTQEMTTLRLSPFHSAFHLVPSYNCLQCVPETDNIVSVNMFATSLSVGNLNSQPRAFKSQGTFKAFIDQQKPETLYS
jgi:hypothetical protein